MWKKFHTLPQKKWNGCPLMVRSACLIICPMTNDTTYWMNYYWKPSSSWSYGSWIYNYMCNQCLSAPLKLLVWTLSWWGLLDKTLCDTVCQWFSSGNPVSSTNKTDCHDITEILLKVALNTINQAKPELVLSVVIYNKYLKPTTSYYIMW
jgi:hypothetical protein